MDSSSSPLAEFRIVAGAHRDAVFALGNDDLLVIGADQSCDICLSDAGIAPRHATLMSQGGCASIRRLDGLIEVDGHAVASSTRVSLRPDARITLGESGVQLQLAGAAVADATSATSVRVESIKARKPRVMASVVMAVLAIIGVALTTQKLGASRASHTQQAPTDLPAVRSLLQEKGLAQQVEVAETAYGVVLSGVIDQKSAATLRGAIATLRTPVIDSTLAESELLDQVREVFRTHGYEASVAYAGDRRVRVDNLDESNQRVRRAATQLRGDIPQLAELSFAAPGSEPPDHVPPYERGSGDRISAHVDGETAYLATTSGARYFIGSTLPGGDTVRRIMPHAIQVDREGQISWFGF